MSNDPITTKLNRAFFNSDTPSNRQISMEDIAKCRGSSQSILSMALNQLRTFWRTGGKFVTDAAVREILQNNGIDKTDDISKIFKESTNSIEIVGKEKHEIKQIKKEQKTAADLAKIFEKAAGTLGYSEVQKSAEKAHHIIDARRQLEKYDPLELLRAAAFEDSHSIPREGVKARFINYLMANPVKDKEDLKSAYRSFVDKLLGQYEDDVQVLSALGNETAMTSYLSFLALEKSGLISGNTVDFEKMTDAEVMKPYLKISKLESFLDKVTNTPIDEKRRILAELFKDSESEQILAGVAKEMFVPESHAFILAMLNFRDLPPDKQPVAKAKILQEFLLDDDSPMRVNYYGDLNDLDAAYEAVTKLYLDNVFTPQGLEKIKSAIIVKAPSEAPKSMEDIFGNVEEQKIEINFLPSKNKNPVQPDEFGGF